MTFWGLSDGQSAVSDSTSFEIEGGSMEPLPDGCHVLATIEDAKWARTQDDSAEYVNIKWAVLKPKEFENRKVFHKLWVTDLDPSAQTREKAKAKRDKAMRMLAAIDKNAGGKLSQSENKPTDEKLQAALVGRMMVIGLRVWDKTNDDGTKSPGGNWVYFVGDKTSELKAGIAVKAKPQSTGFGSVRMTASDDDSEIPF